MVTTPLRAAIHDTVSDHPLLAWGCNEPFTALEALQGKILVIKLGGSTLDHQRAALQDIVWLHSQGVFPLLVHGGGPAINAWLTKLTLQPRFEQGLRVTDSQTLEMVCMVLLGQLNPHLVLMTSQLGSKAIGLSGTDGGMVRAHIAEEHLGLVGQIARVDPTALRTLIEAGYIPIVAPLGQAPDGTCLNINADLVASHLAAALGAARLFFLSNVPGICHANGKLISAVTAAQARWLIEDGVISGGMLPKVQACLDALAWVPCVQILDGREPHALLQALLSEQGAGTMLVR